MPLPRMAPPVPSLAPEPPPAESAAPASGTCANHANLPAIFICRRCNTPICDLCAFPQSDGSRLCPSCATLKSAGPALRAGISSVTLAVQNQKCKQHPNVAAVQLCHFCSAPVCATCDFLLPGNFHACPACATSPQSKLSPKRRKMLVSSYVLAIWCTVIMGALMTGMFAGMVRTKEDEAAFGTLIMIIVLVPAIAGIALGVSSKGRNSTSMASWIAIIWNALFLAGLLLLMVIGALSKG